MKKIIYSSVAILSVIGFIIYGFTSAPKTIHVDQQFEATAYKLEDTSFSKKVSISLSGVFDEKSESYLGRITVNRQEYTNCSLEPKFAIMQCTEAENERPPRDHLAMVLANKDFSVWSLKVQQSNDSGKTVSTLYKALNQGSTTIDDIILSLPATDRDSSLRAFDELMQHHVDELEQSFK
ncbi:hypothetical protein [Paenibacillus wynnii]|uniref:hypothetical protein n=1 Tax=Paenibacillus wynnii TaxID=268407 RepID=UPI00278F6B55|nr:hypothetical protein [Paenibacillus wynnii]MDQ0196374.1 hypothetical protein [Paenibacillus wynnii]